mgnify:CR=1 FL=1
MHQRVFHLYRKSWEVWNSSIILHSTAKPQSSKAMQCTAPLLIYSKSHVAKILVQLHPPLSYFQIYIQHWHSGFFHRSFNFMSRRKLSIWKRFFNCTVGFFFLNKALHETLQIFWNEFYKLAKVSALKMSKSNKSSFKSFSDGGCVFCIWSIFNV